MPRRKRESGDEEIDGEEVFERTIGGALTFSTDLLARVEADPRFRDAERLKLLGLIGALANPDAKESDRISAIKMAAEMLEEVDKREPPDSLRDKPTPELIQLFASLKVDEPSSPDPTPGDRDRTGA
jgi:hypothetical protein